MQDSTATSIAPRNACMKIEGITLLHSCTQVILERIYIVSVHIRTQMRVDNPMSQLRSEQ